jgi:hypothetical protein
VFELHICQVTEDIKSNGTGEIRTYFQIFELFYDIKKFQGREQHELKVEPSVTEGIKTTGSIWYL